MCFSNHQTGWIKGETHLVFGAIDELHRAVEAVESGETLVSQSIAIVVDRIGAAGPVAVAVTAEGPGRRIGGTETARLRSQQIPGVVFVTDDVELIAITGSCQYCHRTLHLGGVLVVISSDLRLEELRLGRGRNRAVTAGIDGL